MACAEEPLDFSDFFPAQSTLAALSPAVPLPAVVAPVLVLFSSLPQAVIMPVSATAAAAATHILLRVLSFTSLAFWVGCATAQITSITGDTENLGADSGRSFDLS